jgi:hypothetical protein
VKFLPNNISPTVNRNVSIIYGNMEIRISINSVTIDRVRRNEFDLR